MAQVFGKGRLVDIKEPNPDNGGHLEYSADFALEAAFFYALQQPSGNARTLSYFLSGQFALFTCFANQAPEQRGRIAGIT